MTSPTRNLRQMDKPTAIGIAQANGHVLQDAPGKHRHGTKWRCIRCNEEVTYSMGELIESLIEEPCNGAPLMRDAIVEAFEIDPIPVAKPDTITTPGGRVHPANPIVGAPEVAEPVKKAPGRPRRAAVPDL